MAKNVIRPPSVVKKGPDPKMDLGKATTTKDDFDAIESGLGAEEGVAPVDPVAAPSAEPEVSLEEVSDPVVPPEAAPSVTEDGTDPAQAAPRTGTLAGVKVSKAPVAPVAPKTAAAPVAPVAPTVPVAPVKPAAPHDPEIDGIKTPEGMNPEKQASFSQLREISRRWKDSSFGYQNENTELKKQITQLKSQPLPPEIQKEVDDARAFRRMFDVEGDPEFKRTHDEKIAATDNEIYSLLEKGGMPKDGIDFMKANDGIRSKPMKWWDEKVLKPLIDSDNPADNAMASVIEGKLKESHQLTYNRGKAIEEASKNGSQWQQQQIQKAQQEREQTELRVKTENQTMMTLTEQLQAQNPWARVQEIPAGATPEEKARIERENKDFTENVMPRFQTAMNPQTPEQKVQVAAAVVLAFKQQDQLEQSYAIIKQLEAQLNKIRSAGKTNNIGNAAPPPGAKAAPSSSDRLKMRNEEAVEAGLSELGA